MSELNWYWVYIPYLDTPEKQKESAISAGYGKVVFKSEADKVIAEKDEATAELKDKLALKTEFAIQCQMAAHTLQRKLRRNKYKRCLAMADKCVETAKKYYYLICLDGGNNPKYDRFPNKMDFWERWHKRWLELAEKFKPNKEGQ